MTRPPQLAAVALVALGAFASGCRAARPEPSPAAEPRLPQVFAASAAVATRSDAPGAWWREFGDERLEGLVREALANNPTLRAASERVGEVAALAREADGTRLPRVDGRLDGTRTRQNVIGIVPGVPLLTNYATSYGLGATVSWELDLWGRLGALRSAADARARATRWDLEGAAQSLAANAVKAWFAAVESSQQVELAELAAANRETARVAEERRLAAGQGGALALELARTEERAARAALVAARERHGRARRALELLLGRYPRGEVEHGARLPALPAPPPAGLPAELFDRRPDLRAARERLEAAADDAAVARAELYPRLSLTASGGTRSNELADLLDGDFRVWSIGGDLLAPLFAGGALRARVEARDARYRAAAEEFAALVLAACGEVEDLLESERLLAERERELAEAERSADAAERIAEERYASGQVDVATVLLARRTALSTRAERVAVRRLRLETRVDLCLAIGGTLAGHDDEAASAAEERP